MKTTRKIIEIDEDRCTGCGQCAPSCAEGALQIIDGKARLVSETYCDGLGACLGECPEGAMRIIERESDEFDPEAVEEYLAKKTRATTPELQTLACGCPSSAIRTFTSCEEASAPAAFGNDRAVPSALTHWPVQIKLVPPNAPFLQGADLLVAADCTPVAYPGFHRDLLPGKVVMVGCPKFDDVEEYVGKFTQVFRQNRINSVTVVEMEVPCCSKLPLIVKKAMADAGTPIPFSEVVITRRGERVEKG